MKFQSQVTNGMVHLSPPGYDDSHIMIKGVAVGSAVQYIASDPPSKTLSRTGSYQSYPSPEMAITGRNCGIVEIVNGTYTIVLKKPNSYYANGGTILLPPHVVLRIWDKDKWVGDGIATLDTMILFHYRNKYIRLEKAHHIPTAHEYCILSQFYLYPLAIQSWRAPYPLSYPALPFRL